MKKGLLQILYIYEYFLRRPHKILFGNAYETNLAFLYITIPLGICAAIYLFLTDHHPFISLAILGALFFMKGIHRNMKLDYISKFIQSSPKVYDQMLASLLDGTLSGSSLAKNAARECALSAFDDSKLRNTFL